MSREEFWQLLAWAIGKRRGKLDRAVAKMDQHLRSLPAAEIEDFARHYAGLQNEANTPAILEAAFIIGCGESNDGFMDFRRWIVWQGEQEFAQIVANPDYLGTYQPKSDPLEQWYCEYEPLSAYEAVTGNELDSPLVAVYPAESSNFNQPQVLAQRYPTLWNRMQAKENARRSLSERGQALFLDAVLERVEDCDGVARFVFSTGAEIRIRDYWAYYRARYQVAGECPCYEDHPMVGQAVVAVATDCFPHSFHMWFANRRKLALACEVGVCCDFEVFDGTQRVSG